MAKKIDDQAIIAELQRVAQLLNTKHLSKDQYQKYGRISWMTAANHFGSWSKALRAAGLIPGVPKNKDLLSDDDLLREIITVTHNLKKIPSGSELTAHGRYSLSPYENRWGSLGAARNAAYAKYGLPSELDSDTPTKPISTTAPKNKSRITPIPAQSTIANNLKPHLLKITNPDTRSFVEEAIDCLEAGLYRSAVVMSWIGAVAILYAHVITNKLDDFNAEAQRRDQKWKTAATKDDLALMKESEFLDILAALSILGKNVKEQLKNNCLGLRNACGHPNSYKIGRSQVESHLEILLLNVYEAF